MSEEISPDQLLGFAQVNANLTYGLNALWLVVMGAGILFMQVGFMALEVGVVKAKNVKATIFKNLFDHAVGTLGWYIIGYSLFMGDSPLAAGSGEDVTWFTHSPAHFAKIFQQYAFAVTACTIVSGAVISRCRFEIYLVFSFLLAAYIYPIFAHLCWNPAGYLAQLGFLDFAGGAVVHLLGGTAALVGAAACGPRVGRFSLLPDGEQQEQEQASATRRLLARFKSKYRIREEPGHSAELQGLGALFLYVAWFSFNGGSGGMITSPFLVHIAGRAAVNTMLACGSASIAGLFWSNAFRDSYSMDLGVNTLLSGLVAITAPCGYIAPWAAFLVGILSVPVYVATSHIILHQLHVDDPLNAVAVHASNGLLGVVWIGLADLNQGLFYTGSAHLLGVQCLGCAIAIAWSGVNAFVFFYGIKWLGPIASRCKPSSSGGIRRRLTRADFFNSDIHPNALVYAEDVQLVGMDFVNFGGSAYPDFDVEAVTEYNETRRIKERLMAKQQHRAAAAAAARPGSEDWRGENSVHRFKDSSTHHHATPALGHAHS